MGMVEWHPPTQVVTEPWMDGLKHRVGIGFDPKDNTLFPFTECCRMRFVWVRVVDPLEMFWACEKCRKPHRGVAAGAATKISIHEPQNFLRTFVSKWIGRSMHDIRVDVEF